MSLANRLDEQSDDTGQVVFSRQWPAADTGNIVENSWNGSSFDETRNSALTPTEAALWADVDDQDDRDADAAALKDDLQNAKDMRDEASQSRTDMDPAAPLAKWEPLTGAGNQSVRIAALEALVNDLLVEQRRQYGDTRLTGAMLVRKFRKDRDDE